LHALCGFLQRFRWAVGPLHIAACQHNLYDPLERTTLNLRAESSEKSVTLTFSQPTLQQSEHPTEILEVLIRLAQFVTLKIAAYHRL
jgi:hypothetical protein